jgi:magnesium and cobalt exporter, CNNM family
MSIAIALTVFFIALLLQALFAGYETGFVSSSTIRIRYLAEEEDNARAKQLLRFVEKPDQMLTMLLVATNIATISGTIIMTREFGEIYAPLIVTPCFLIFAEIIPKSVFRIHSTRLVLALFPVIRVFRTLLFPLVAPVTLLTSLLLRFINGRGSYISPFMSSLDDVRNLVDESADHGAIEREEQRLIHSVIDLQTKQAKEIMVPRIDMQALPNTATRGELVALFSESGRTRIPIYRESIDEIVGVVTAHDVLLDTETGQEDLPRLLRDVMHVPDTIAIDDLLETMKAEKQHIAIVTDEYGGTDGLVTLEDILEEIFGEIQDEHDKEESPIRKVGPDAYVIDARISLEDAAEFMDLKLEDEEVETIGGWLMHLAGAIPAQGDVITHNGFRMTVLDGGVNYIAKIRLEVLPEARGTDAEEEG